MSTVLGVGIVGMGWAAGEHFKVYQNNPCARVVGVCSRTREGAQAKLVVLSKEVDVEGVKTYTSYDEMVADPAIDIIDICSPPSFHVSQAIAAAEAGKHLVIEKPIALNLPDLRKLQQAVKAAKVKSAVCFEVHYHPQAITLKNLLATGIIGPISYIETDYFHGIGPWYKQYDWNTSTKDGGSALLSAGCHALDILLHFAGGNVVEVASFGGKSPNNPLKYEYDPHSVTILKFDNGVIGKCAASIDYVGPYYFPFEIHGELGCIRDNRFFSKALGGQNAMAEIPMVMLDSGDVTHHPYEAELNELIDCVLEDRTHPVDVECAARTHEVIFAADMSAAEGRIVRMAEIR